MHASFSTAHERVYRSNSARYAHYTEDLNDYANDRKDPGVSYTISDKVLTIRPKTSLQRVSQCQLIQIKSKVRPTSAHLATRMQVLQVENPYPLDTKGPRPTTPA
jgi:hypothetical protein